MAPEPIRIDDSSAVEPERLTELGDIETTKNPGTTYPSVLCFELHPTVSNGTACQVQSAVTAEKSTSTTLLVDYFDDDSSLAAKWHRLIKKMHKPIIRALVSLARMSANNPKRTISFITLFSVLVLVAGLFTNFNVDTDEDTLFSPQGSRPISHLDWIDDTSGFPASSRHFLLNIHANGDNVVGQDGVSRVFTAIDAIRNTRGYSELCQVGGTEIDNGITTCRITSCTMFWNNTAEIFKTKVDSDDEAIVTLSQDSYPDGSPVDVMAIVGSPKFDNNGLLERSPVFLVQIDLPQIDDAEGFELRALENIQDLQDSWKSESGNAFRVEFFADRSFSDEFYRAIVNDIPLLPAVFVMMSIFTSFVFFKRDKVQSRSSLGFGAVFCVLLAIITGYGLLFIIGTPFTSMTQILPFIMFGIGLDAAFILSGAFYRTDVKKDIIERIGETVEEVGISITLTTLTSALAFALGCMSSIPAVIWLCLYAFPTIIIDFLYQMTFFVAIMALDEKRVLENRRDCLCCVTVKDHSNTENEGEGEGTENEAEASSEDEQDSPGMSMTDRFMVWFAGKLLMNGFVKAAVILAFTGLLAGCAYSASLLEQNFDFTEVIPDDSYIAPFFDVLNDYTSRGGVVVDVYFRDEDQSSIVIQDQMDDYMNSLVDMRQIDAQPTLFWIRDFRVFVASNDYLQDLPFYEQFEVFYNDPIYNDLYGDHIVLNESGVIMASRTTVYMNNIENDIVTELIDTLEGQRDISAAQPVNVGKADWSFFTYAPDYLIFEFYSQAVDELTLTTILGVVAVCVLSTIFIPHWTAFFFVAPLICVLYIDLLGVLQFAGIAINPVSYVAMVMSIGLLVDFVVHILFRYYEVQGDRRTRTTEMLRTMGSSVMLGGISTFLGVLPLAFSTSTIFFTIFVTFMGLVALGIAHGLILLPVLLSIFGPESKEIEVSEKTQRDLSIRNKSSLSGD